MELVNFTCEWPNSQLDPPLVAGFRRSVVNHSVALYVSQHDCKSIASHSWNFLSHANFCRARQVTRGGRTQVVGRSLIGCKALQASRRSVATVSRRLGCDCDSGARVYADRLTNGVRGSRACRGAVASHSYYLASYTFFVSSYVSRSPKSMSMLVCDLTIKV